MHVTLSPQVRNDDLSLHVDGGRIKLNDHVLDFSQLSDGDIIPADDLECEWVVGQVCKEGGEIHVTVILPISSDALEEDRFPEPIIVTSGKVI